MKEQIYFKEFEKPIKMGETFDDLPLERHWVESEFISKVRAFAEHWQVDTEIFREGEGLEVHFYFPFHRFTGILLLELDRLVRMSNGLCIPLRKNRPCKTEWILSWK